MIDSSVMKDILTLNKDMLQFYNKRDYTQLEPISRLVNPNEYDLYLVVCALCNYSNDFLDQERLFKLRAELFSQLKPAYMYSHMSIDYEAPSDKKKAYCTNPHRQNKYHLHELEIFGLTKEEAQSLWLYRDNISYVDPKDDKVVVSIRGANFYGFLDVLNIFDISYNIDELSEGIVFLNESNNTLVDYHRFSLPFEPYDFQIEDAKKIVAMKRALIGHEMGAGKTLISIMVGESINEKKLIICPESLRLNWRKEILQFNKDADVLVLYSKDEFRLAEWTILGYITAVKHLDELLAAKVKCLFIDEAHNCKAVSAWGKPTSKRANAAVKLAEAAEYVYLITGTPMPKNNSDLFNLLKMIKSPIIDTSAFAFKRYGDRFCDPVQTKWGVDYSRNSNTDELHSILSKQMVRRLKKDVLPHLKYRRQFIPIEPHLTREYKNIEKRLVTPLENDTYMGLAMTGRKLLSTIKIEAAIDLAESILEAEEQVVIVTNFIDSANKLKEHFKDKACEIRGGMSDVAKDDAITQFQSHKKQVCIMNMQAGGVGITLTAANNMIMLDYDWLPAINEQAEQRIVRPGQNSFCNIYYIYCTNSVFDDLFVRMISEKAENISKAIDNSDNLFDLATTLSESSTYLELLKKEIKAKYGEQVTTPKRRRKVAKKES